MRTGDILILAFVLTISGCEGCRRESAPPAPAPPAQAPAAPAAGAPEAAAPAPAEEDDCIVIVDANPDYGPPPLAVEFTAEAECTRGQPTYKWEFGDGGTSTDTNPSHTYANAGDFTAVVTVTAGTATATDEIDITVEEGAEPEEP
jgi:hypothetical protein